MVEDGGDAGVGGHETSEKEDDDPLPGNIGPPCQKAMTKAWQISTQPHDRC